MTLPTVAIVVPVRNEGRNIKACLDGWNSQTVPVRQIVVIDSGSSDDTVAIAKSYANATVIEILGEEFNHGTTRNRAVAIVDCDFTLMTVGDARPADDKVLEKLLMGFSDPKVAGVCGLQIVPHEVDKNPVEWFRPVSEPRTKSFSYSSPEEFDALTPDQKQEAASWDDVIAMYRTPVLRDQIPFREITYGEDPAWAVDALRAGYTLLYDSSAHVYHYHLESAELTYKRAITMLCLRNWMFGAMPQMPQRGLRSRLSLVRSLMRAHGLTLRNRWRWYCFNRVNQNALERAIIDFLDALQLGPERVKELHSACAGKPFKIISAE